MKRILMILCVLALCLSVFVGCSENEDIPLEYTSEVLIDKEHPDEYLVWAGRIQTPTKGVSILESAFPKSTIFGIVGQGHIDAIDWNDRDEYVKSYDTDDYDLHKILKMSKEEQLKKFNHAIYKDRGQYEHWEDAVLFHLFIPEDNVYKEKPTEYAGKYLFIEYREKDDEVYIQALTKEEYEKTPNERIISNFKGRIGDIYYLTYGYYDLSQHKYKCYDEEAELPKYHKDDAALQINGYDLYDLLRENEILLPHLPKQGVYNVENTYRVGDMIYISIAEDERYGEDDPDYKSWLMLLMLDADTYEVLYAEKYESTNYNLHGSDTLILYQKGSDGFLYAPYIVE